ncbi:MAG: glucose-6-phosphate isomerase [Gammaproteobacteria bacterium]|nr:glucose-6-phosphate isomerase [Gammaproteobacteria bacterium]
MPATRDPTQLAAWGVLQSHRDSLASSTLRELFGRNPGRFDEYRLEACDLLLDYSKNRLTRETLPLLLRLAEECELPQWIEALFEGHSVNTTEGRPALHMALRGSVTRSVDAGDVGKLVSAELDKMTAFVNAVERGEIKGATGKPLNDVISIGIGGSDLGAVMVTEALKDYATGRTRVRFVSSIDGVDLGDVLADADPERTLFVVCSKSFTTLETMTNARAARQWVADKLGDERAAGDHFVAISTNDKAMDSFGVPAGHRFAMWDWVGGRFSVTSAVGLPVALAIGMKNFRDLLAGAREIDEHFRDAPLATNLPVIMGMLSIWNINFLGLPHFAMLPYDQRLHRFPAYLQQLDMESNGKRVRRDAEAVATDTGSIIFGEPGPNAQHSFYQLLHQGTRDVPVDFLVPAEGSGDFSDQHKLSIASCLAQSRAFMAGRSEAEVLADLTAGGMPTDEAMQIAQHKVHPGNRPSNTLVFARVEPATVGKLIALYEHRVFVQSAIWGINAFDQWGVQLGKILADQLIPSVDNDERPSQLDSSTDGLLDYINRLRR